MIDSGSNPACLRRGRHYRFQTIPSEVTTPPGSEPIIQYGNVQSSFYDSVSDDTLPIDPELVSSINVTALNPENNPYGVKVGWIVYLFGGLQKGISRTQIEVKTQKGLSILVETLMPDADLTYRIGQVVTIKLSTDTSKSMTATIKAFDNETGTMVVDVTTANGEGTYPALPFGYWMVDVVGILPRGTSVDWMLARVSSVDLSNPESPLISFASYQSSGFGTYSKWYLVVQWEYARNFIRNENRAAFDASIGQPDQNDPGAKSAEAFLNPGGGNVTSESHDTSNLPLVISGYTETTLQGLIVVVEDEYMAHRPYLDRKIEARAYIETVVETTTVTYDSMGNPTYNTVSSVENESKSYDYTFTDNDFKKEPPGGNYIPGNPAFYVNGELVAFPTPSKYVQMDASTGSVTFKSNEYYRLREPYPNPDDPDGPPLYRDILLITTYRVLGAEAPTQKPTPESFFWPG